MITVRRSTVALFVERSAQQWVVRDPDSKFWIVPSSKTPGTIGNRSTPPKRRSLNRFPDIIYTCLTTVLIKEGCAMNAKQVSGNKR